MKKKDTYYRGDYFSRVMITLCLALFIGTGTLMGAPPRNASFKWKKVPGAAAYRVEIATLAGKVLIRRETRVPIVRFRLPYGTYRGRVAALNRFRKRSPWSRWFNFTIKRSLKPEFSSAFPDTLSPEDGTVEITIKGDNFMENVALKLLKNGKEVKGIEFVRKSFERITFRVDSENLPGGYFDLAITNPGDNQIMAQQVFQVSASPEVKDISPSRMNQGDAPAEVTVKGKRFLKGVSAFFRKGSTMLRPASMTRKDTETLSLKVDPSKGESGSYDLIIMNPGENNAIISDSFRIFNNIGLYFGFAPVVSFPGYGEGANMDSKFLGGHLLAAWNPMLFEDIPVINIMGLEMEFLYMNFAREVNNTYDLVTWNYGLGLTFTFEITQVFNIVFRGGGGLTRSTLKNTPRGNLSSSDPYVYGGGSFRFNIADIVFLETGVQFCNIFYISRNVDSLLGLLRVGVIF